MEDSAIIELYFNRNENAITETDKKYGVLCRKIAFNILSVNEDTEECVNDSYYKAWTLIPPERPNSFMAWLGKIVRNTALNIYSKLHAKKRFNGIDLMLDELQDCIPASGTPETELEDKEISMVISKWLKELSEEDRYLFIRRYWYGDSVNELADGMKGVNAHTLAQRLYRLRSRLRERLEREEICL